jgi:hypothetical protein
VDVTASYRRALATSEALLRDILAAIRRQTQDLLTALALLAPGAPGTFAGRVNTVAVTEVSLAETPYIEQTANGGRSIVSTSALDTAAGTGARTVRIIYYSIVAGVVTGPFTETVALNGLVPVNTVAVNIGLVQQMEVLTVGVTGANQGILNLFTGLGATGVVFTSIAVTRRTALLGHQYIVTGQTLVLTKIAVSSRASSGNSPTFALRSLDLSSSTAAEQLVVDGIQAQGHANTALVIEIGQRIQGPARLRAYVTPENALAQVQRLDASWYTVAQ